MSYFVIGSAPSDPVSVSRWNNFTPVAFGQVDGIPHASNGQNLEECIRQGLVQNFADHLAEHNGSKLAELELGFSGELKFEVVDGFEQFSRGFGECAVESGLQSYLEKVIPELCSSRFWMVTYPLPLLLKSNKRSPTLEVVLNLLLSYPSISAMLIPIGSVRKPRSNFMSTVTAGEKKPYFGPKVPYAFLKRVALLVAIPSTQPVNMRSLIAFQMACSTLLQSQAHRASWASKIAITSLIINNLRRYSHSSINHRGKRQNLILLLRLAYIEIWGCLECIDADNNNNKYNCRMEQQPVAPVEKTPEQLEQQLKQRQEEERLKEQQRKKAEQEARIKAEEDLKKLQQALKGGLSGLGKTANNRTVAYTRLSIAEKQIQRLFPVVLRFKEVRYLDLNTNAISDISLLTQFPHLLWINASKNQVSSLETFSQEGLEQLQFLNLSGNKVKALTHIALPALRRLNLSENEISQVNWKGHHGIEILELRKNKLRKLKGISAMKNLKQLYVCENELTDIRGLQGLPSLQKLSVRNNKIKSIYSPFPFLPALTYLNLRENQIAKLQQLKKVDTHVTGINILQNPVTDELGENLKKEAVYLMPHLIKVNKTEVTVQERVAFEKEMLQKLAEKERERLAQEQEARKAQEEKAQ